MKPLQQQAFQLAVKTLDATSKFYRDDLAELRAHYGKMPDHKANEAIARFNTKVSQDEINRNCQL